MHGVRCDAQPGARSDWPPAASSRTAFTLGVVIMTTGTIHSKVAGVTAKNDNGRSRQDYIRAFCKAGMPLILRREPQNKFDKNAISVWIKAKALIFFSSEVQIGYINAELAEELSRWIDNGKSLSAEIAEVTGGTKEKSSLGVNILLRKG